MADPATFFGTAGGVLAALAAVLEDAAALHGVATARGYDQWQDVDLTESGKTRNDLLAVLYFLDDLQAFVSNGTPSQADRMPTIHKYRTDL